MSDKPSIKREIFLEIYIAIVFASFTAFPFYGDMGMAKLLRIWIYAAIVWFAITWVLIKRCDYLVGWLHNSFAKLDERMAGLKDWTFYLLAWGIIIIAWIPAFLALYPGIFGYDAPLQLCQWMGTMEMTDHHPVAHTALLGILYNIGSTISGSPNGGIALYTIVQALCVTSALAYVVYVMRRFGASSIYILLSLIWMAFNPFLKVLSFNSTKDIFYGVMMAYFMMLLYQWLMLDSVNRRMMISLISSGILMCLFRHQGVYVLAVFAIFALFMKNADGAKLLKSKKWMTVISIVIIILVTEAFSVFCHKVMHFEPGDSREMLSLPMQQMAYVCDLKLEGQPVDVTDEDLAQVERFIPRDGIESYENNTADPVKSTFDTETFKSDLIGNVALYIRLGIHNPGEYIYAFGNMIGGYVDSERMPYLGLMFLYTFEDQYKDNVDIYKDSHLSSYYDLLTYETVGLGYRNIPLMSLLYRSGLCVWLLVALVGVTIYRRNYRLWLLVLPMVLYMASLLLGPVALIRYLYPLIMLVPFMIYLLFGKNAV